MRKTRWFSNSWWCHILNRGSRVSTDPGSFPWCQWPLLWFRHPWFSPFLQPGVDESTQLPAFQEAERKQGWRLHIVKEGGWTKTGGNGWVCVCKPGVFSTIYSPTETLQNTPIERWRTKPKVYSKKNSTLAFFPELSSDKWIHICLFKWKKLPRHHLVSDSHIRLHNHTTINGGWGPAIWWYIPWDYAFINHQRFILR